VRTLHVGGEEDSARLKVEVGDGAEALEPGALVVNFMNDDPKFDLTRAERLESRLGLPFTRYVSRLRAMNPCTAAELIIGA
jgi:hypothetical protein